MHNSEILDSARQAWNLLSDFRRKRRRCTDFMFGRQWGDRHRLTDGRIVSEESQWLESGRVPMCNNLIRQLVKSIVGRWRYNHEGDENVRDDDARAFEEFILSGIAAQRVDPESGAVINVSPARLFFTRCEHADGSDAALVGMLHDMAATEVAERFAPDDPREFSRLVQQINSAALGSDFDAGRLRQPPCRATRLDFDRPDNPGAVRIIEVWQKTYSGRLRIHDTETGRLYLEAYDERTLSRVEEINRERKAADRPLIKHRAEMTASWTGYWLTTDGTLLRRETAREHPFVMALYPMVDGEVHSLVEDVIDQQKSVNNLVMLLDSVLRATAKGVVLFPTDQLPRGMSWQDVRRIWSQPGGILPFKRTSKNIMPYQLNTGGTIAGAGELLATQMRLFDEISGTSASSRGSASTAKGAEMMRSELEQANISIYDLLESFEAFINRRELKLLIPENT